MALPFYLGQRRELEERKRRIVHGVWRSWLARTHGVREAGGSSPLTPTNL